MWRLTTGSRPSQVFLQRSLHSLKLPQRPFHAYTSVCRLRKVVPLSAGIVSRCSTEAQDERLENLILEGRRTTQVARCEMERGICQFYESSGQILNNSRLCVGLFGMLLLKR